MDDFDIDAALEESEQEEQPKRKGPGRPKGSRNKAKLDIDGKRAVPAGLFPMADYRHADPDALVARMLSIIDWQQQALRNEMMKGAQAIGDHISPADVKKCIDLANALGKTIDSLKRAADVADEMKKRKTPAQLLEIAIQKIEGQDLPTLEKVIFRLRKHREELAPVDYHDELKMGAPPGKTRQKAMNAAEAINALGESSDEADDS